MKIRTSETRSALAEIGDYYVLTVDVATMHPRLRRVGDRFVCAELPEGLPPAEAFGLTLAHRWAELEQRGEAVPLVRRHGNSWQVSIPGEPTRELQTDRAVVIARALLAVRRVIRPCPRPFAPRDPVAELLQLHLRAMETQLRGATPVETLHPPTFRSDMGRDWSGAYD